MVGSLTMLSNPSFDGCGAWIKSPGEGGRRRLGCLHPMTGSYGSEAVASGSMLAIHSGPERTCVCVVRVCDSSAFMHFLLGNSLLSHTRTPLASPCEAIASGEDTAEGCGWTAVGCPTPLRTVRGGAVGSGGGQGYGRSLLLRPCPPRTDENGGEAGISSAYG